MNKSEDSVLKILAWNLMSKPTGFAVVRDFNHIEINCADKGVTIHITVCKFFAWP